MSTRRGSKKNESSWLTTRTLIIAGAVLAAIILAPAVLGFFRGGDTPEILEGHVQEFEEQSRDHVPEGTQVDYSTHPPTSGPHYNSWARPGLYREEVATGLLVHNLEHGHVVIYYDESRLSDAAAGKLTELTQQYDGDWDAVLAVPRQDEENELILTAWNYKLELEQYDEELVDAFVDAYRGRGPENPVR
jgi:hypothetical protein